MPDAATQESPVTPSAEAQAIDMLSGVDLIADVEGDDGSTPAPVETAPPEPAAPAPTAEPAKDDVAELFAKLEARKAERAAKQGAAPDVVAQLQSQIAALEARLAQPPAHVPQDFPALVRQHGEVEAMRMVGIDPLEFFSRFKTVAKDPDSIRRQQAELEHANKLKEIGEAQAKQSQTLEQWQAQQKAEADRVAWNSYIRMVESPDTGTPLLAKLPVMERVERTQRKIAQLHEQYGEAAADVSDVDIARLVEKDIRSLRDLLAGTEASVKPPQVPTTDGAKQPQIAASLTNDVASQSTGSERVLSEKERVAQAVKIMMTATD